MGHAEGGGRGRGVVVEGEEEEEGEGETDRVNVSKGGGCGAEDVGKDSAETSTSKLQTMAHLAKVFGKHICKVNARHFTFLCQTFCFGNGILQKKSKTTNLHMYSNVK